MKPLVPVAPGAKVALGIAFFVLFVAVWALATFGGFVSKTFLADPLQPGLWYMRYQGSVYAGRGARKDGPAAFLAQLERPAAVPPPPTEPAHDGEAAPPTTTTAAAAAT